MTDLDRVYDLINNRSEHGLSWLSDNIVFLVESGSHAYGTDTEESDKDYKGIVIPPMEYHIGLHTFKSVQIETGAKDEKNTRDDIDITLYSLKEFTRLALNSNPNIIEMLYVEEDSIIVDYKPLRCHRDMFLTDKLRKSYGGFGVSMMRRMEKAIAKGEYDGKTLMNILRILESGRDAMLTGTLQTKRPNAEALLSIRHLGLDMKYDSHVEFITKLMDSKYGEFKQAEEGSVLPSKPKHSEVEDLLMELTKQHLGLE